jgi:hypothetical protein
MKSKAFYFLSALILILSILCSCSTETTSRTYYLPDTTYIPQASTKVYSTTKPQTTTQKKTTTTTPKASSTQLFSDSDQIIDTVYNFLNAEEKWDYWYGDYDSYSLWRYGSVYGYVTPNSHIMQHLERWYEKRIEFGFDYPIIQGSLSTYDISITRIVISPPSETSIFRFNLRKDENQEWRLLHQLLYTKIHSWSHTFKTKNGIILRSYSRLPDQIRCLKFRDKDLLACDNMLF